MYDMSEEQLIFTCNGCAGPKAVFVNNGLILCYLYTLKSNSLTYKTQSIRYCVIKMGVEI